MEGQQGGQECTEGVMCRLRGSLSYCHAYPPVSQGDLCTMHPSSSTPPPPPLPTPTSASSLPGVTAVRLVVGMRIRSDANVMRPPVTVVRLVKGVAQAGPDQPWGHPWHTRSCGRCGEGGVRYRLHSAVY